jgi:hypothetical protein
VLVTLHPPHISPVQSIKGPRQLCARLQPRTRTHGDGGARQCGAEDLVIVDFVQGGCRAGYNVVQLQYIALQEKKTSRHASQKGSTSRAGTVQDIDSVSKLQ